MTEPLVSIIIPCYNAEKYVAESIQSALDQTYPRCEVIVIDDGSTDGSLDVIKSFGDRIRWETGPNRGGCAARNRGFEISKGEWIQFLDADDRISAQKIKVQVDEVIRAPEGSVAVCPWRYFDDNGISEPAPRVFWKNYKRGIDFLVDTWLEGGFMCAHCWLVSRKQVERCGGWDEKLTADQDGDFFGKILANAGAVLFAVSGEAYYRRPAVGNVSQVASIESLNSRFLAWQAVQEEILIQRKDVTAQKAVLRRLRGVAYVSRHCPHILEAAHRFEKIHRIMDFNPRAPLYYRMMTGLFGIKVALKLRSFLKK